MNPAKTVGCMLTNVLIHYHLGEVGVHPVLQWTLDSGCPRNPVELALYYVHYIEFAQTELNLNAQYVALKIVNSFHSCCTHKFLSKQC